MEFVYHSTLARKKSGDWIDHYEKSALYGLNDIQLALEYSVLLKKYHKYEKNIYHLQKTSSVILAPDIEFALGDAFLSVENYDSATIHYENVHYLSPSKFRPLYKIAKVNYERKKFKIADSIAQVIIQRKPKINSAEIIMIKEEMKVMLKH